MLGCNWEALPCLPWLPYHFSFSFHLFSSCSHVVRFIYFGGWCNWIHPYVYILIINLCLLFIIMCSLLCINACFGLITLCLMLWCDLLLGNAFELRNGEEHLMGFVFRNEAKPLSHLLTFVLIVCHLVRLVNGLLVWLRGLDYFHSRDQSLSIFLSWW